MKTIILIPTYNERENIRVLVPKIFAAVPEVTVMVIDDNSPDGTARVVKELEKEFPRLILHPRPGKEGLGRAYLEAFQRVLTHYADTELICTMDADRSHHPEYLPALIHTIKRADYVIGSRYLPGGSIVGWEPWRKFLSAWGNAYCRLITKLPVRDCTSGFGCIRTSLLRQINFSDFDTSGYAFLIYLKYKAWKLGGRLAEVPICFTNRITGESKISMKIIREGLLLPWKLIRKETEKQIAVPCPICGGQAKFWFEKNRTSVHRCSDCQLIFVHPLPMSLSYLYRQDYFCGATDGFGYINYDSDKAADAATFDTYLRLIEKYTADPGRLLDVGTATGAFVAAAIKHGWQAEGVEISEYAAAAGRKRGLTIHTGELEATPLTPGSFDAVTLWDVFEHVRDPRASLRRIHELLKPQGLMVLNTPDAGSLHARLRQKKWPLIIPPEHLHIFNRKNIAQLLGEQGFEILLTTTVGKKFTLAYIFQILYTNRHFKPWRQLSNLIRKTPLKALVVPINLHDNMFIIAQKRT